MWKLNCKRVIIFTRFMQGYFSHSNYNSTSYTAKLLASQCEFIWALFKPVIVYDSCTRADLRDTYPANILVRVAQRDYMTTLNWSVSNSNPTCALGRSLGFNLVMRIPVISESE